MSCLICHEPGQPLCSETCRRAANRELDSNLARLKAIPAGHGNGRRYEFAEHNGELTSALLTWPCSPSGAA